MKNTAKALGLPEDASEGDVLAKVSELTNDNKTLKNRIDELEGDLEDVRNREVDAQDE